VTKAFSRLSRYGPLAVGGLLILAVFFALSGAFAQEGTARAQSIKAAIILNIARFVSWPEGALKEGDNLRLCLYRVNSLGQGINEIRGRTVKGHRLNIAIAHALEQTAGCNILFVPSSELQRFGQDVTAQVATTLLTIADGTEGQAQDGVMERVVLRLVRIGSRIGFDINMALLKASDLGVSSELLKLARPSGRG